MPVCVNMCGFCDVERPIIRPAYKPMQSIRGLGDWDRPEVRLTPKFILVNKWHLALTAADARPISCFFVNVYCYRSGVKHE